MPGGGEVRKFKDLLRGKDLIDGNTTTTSTSSGVRGGGGSFLGVVVVGSVGVGGVGGQHVKTEPLMLLFRLGKKIKRWWFLPFIGSRRGRRFKYSKIELLKASASGCSTRLMFQTLCVV